MNKPSSDEKENVMQNCVERFREEYWFLSNFYPAKICFDGIIYNNSESAYQAQKLADKEARHQFSNCYGDEAKRMGEKIEIRPDWEDVKLDLMEKILAAKFTQHPYLAQLLVETKDMLLYEGNTWGDIFWGVDLQTKEGENHLGKLLMSIREKLQREGIEEHATYPVLEYDSGCGIWATDKPIIEMDADAIVIDAEENLLHSEGLNMEIHRAAGSQLEEECAEIGVCSVGKAIITKGYLLLAKNVIHTVSPVYGRDEEELLDKCYISCLEVCKENDLHSIVFPILAVGKHCFPRQKAVDTAIEVIRKWLMQNDNYFLSVCVSCQDHRLYAAVCDELRELSNEAK